MTKAELLQLVPLAVALIELAITLMEKAAR